MLSQSKACQQKKSLSGNKKPRFLPTLKFLLNPSVEKDDLICDIHTVYCFMPFTSHVMSK